MHLSLHLAASPANYKDFIVRRERVHKWLILLQKWNPAYRIINISMNNVNLIPLKNLVYHDLR